MTFRSAAALAHPNIALVKYWGNRDDELHLAANSSLSMNLAGLETRTTVEFTGEAGADEIVVNGTPMLGKQAERVSGILDLVREMADLHNWAKVESSSNFPQGAGIASSAAAFAALAVAASHAAGLSLSEAELSRLARRGSGSACRSIPGGFVEWTATDRDETSVARSIAPPEHWALTDLVAVVSREHKAVGSTGGHALAPSSPLQAARVADTPRRFHLVKEALLARDFAALAHVVEQDSDMMHGVMMTSAPPLHYWLPPTLAVMEAVRRWRAEGLAVCYTIDAGPNVHVLCAPGAAEEARGRLEAVPGVLEILEAGAGGPAELIAD